MRFPLLSEDRADYPKNHRCAWCKKGRLLEPHSFAVFSGGAMLIDRRTGDGGPDPRLDGFSGLTWHGAHEHWGGKGEFPEIYENVEFARNVHGGQFDFSFCSIRCLRSFMNHAVDELERKVLKEAKRTGPKGRSSRRKSSLKDRR